MITIAKEEYGLRFVGEYNCINGMVVHVCLAADADMAAMPMSQEWIERQMVQGT